MQKPLSIGVRAAWADARWRAWVLGARVIRKLLRMAGRDDAAASWSMRHYARWLEGLEPSAGDIESLRAQHHPDGPLLSILMPVFDPCIDHLRCALESVSAQTYTRWELCICDDASRNPQVRELIESAAGRDTRIRVVLRPENTGIAGASAAALKLARGSHVVLLDHDDMLAPWALHFIVAALRKAPGARLLYSDEDKLDEMGRRCAPHFKPDWNPDLLHAVNYVGHLVAIERGLLEEIGGFRRGYDGSQDYDLILRCEARLSAEEVVHIPAILYHWRQSPGSTALDASAKRGAHAAGVAALRSRFADDAGVRVDSGPFPTTYRVSYPVPAPEPRVSILIPTRDGGDHLRRCVDGILERSTYASFEIILIDNQSREPQTLQYLEAVASHDKVRVIRYDHAFNYSAINNFAAREASGDVLLLLNDDIEVRSTGWLEELVSRLYAPGVGAVGAKLYYPDGTVQHGGVVLGLGGVAGHSHKFAAADAAGYFFRLVLPQTLSAVTGACLMVRRSDYLALGGLDEDNLPVAFNDVDFCLRLGERGLRCVWTPYAELTHHESLSRGSDETPLRKRAFEREKAYMRRRWAEVLARDPHYNRNLTLAREDFSLADVPRPYIGWLYSGAQGTRG